MAPGKHRNHVICANAKDILVTFTWWITYEFSILDMLYDLINDYSTLIYVCIRVVISSTKISYNMCFTEITWTSVERSQIARFMWPTWGPSGADWGPMLASWTLLSAISKMSYGVTMPRWVNVSYKTHMLNYKDPIAPFNLVIYHKYINGTIVIVTG